MMELPLVRSKTEMPVVAAFAVNKASRMPAAIGDSVIAIARV